MPRQVLSLTDLLPPLPPPFCHPLPPGFTAIYGPFLAPPYPPSPSSPGGVAGAVLSSKGQKKRRQLSPLHFKGSQLGPLPHFPSKNIQIPFSLQDHQPRESPGGFSMPSSFLRRHVRTLLRGKFSPTTSLEEQGLEVI